MRSITLQIPRKLRLKDDDFFLFCAKNKNLRIECYNKKSFQKLIVMIFNEMHEKSAMSLA